MSAPLDKPVVSLSIHDVAFGGQGVARHEGMAVFLPFVITGEEVEARLVRKKKKFGEAELLEVKAASPARVEPRCEYFGRCGGCAYQHMTYEEQVAVKHHQVEQTIRRLGRLAEVPMEPLVPAPEPYGYRNRIRVHAAGGVVGFYAHGARALVDIAHCPISSTEVNEGLADLRSRPVEDGDYTISGRSRRAFFEQTNDAVARLLVEVVQRKVRAGQELLVDAFCGAGLFAQNLKDQFEHVVGIEENVYAIEQARKNAGPKERYIAGDVAVYLGEALTGAPLERTTVVLDPPAAGVSARVLDLLTGMRPAQVIYVSCQPGTLARDLAALTAGGYRLKSVTPVDMFPQTAEIEVVVDLALEG